MKNEEKTSEYIFLYELETISWTRNKLSNFVCLHFSIFIYTIEQCFDRQYFVQLKLGATKYKEISIEVT